MASTPAPGLFLYNRGALNVFHSDYRKAHSLFVDAVALRPDDPGLLLMAGQTAAEVGDMESAQAWLTRYLELHPEAATGYLARAHVYRETGRAGLAEADLAAALRSDPESADVHVALGRFLAESGRSEEALALLAKRSDLPITQQPRLRLLRARVLVQLDRPSDARELLEQVIAADDPTGPRSQEITMQARMLLERINTPAVRDGAGS
jgi:predicted Zn-dependent protease